MTFYTTAMSVWSYIAIGALRIIWTPFELILFVLLWPFDKRRNIVGRFYRLSSVSSIKLNPLWDFGVYGPLPEKTPEKTVVVANHCSFADVGLLSFLPWEMKWLSKRTIFYIPAIGTGMLVAGDVPLDRGNRDSAKNAMGRMRDWLDKGANVMIFPEGTRSENGVTGEFKDGAFRLAIEAQADVLPCAIVGTSNALRKGSWKMNPSKGRVMAGKPISTKGMQLADVEKLKLQVRSKIVEMCNEMERETGSTAQHSSVSVEKKTKKQE